MEEDKSCMEKFQRVEKHDQNTYSKAVWLITDLSDKPLGHFVTTKEDSNGVIPGS